jgi:predicted methyltransferase
MKRLKAAAAFGVLSACWLPAAAADPVPPDLQKVLTAPWRTNDPIRDQFRHPAEFLKFCDIRPGMAVADYMPAGGFYTRILIIREMHVR